YDTGVMTLMRLAYRVRPPGEHDVEHQRQADEERPRRRQGNAEYRKVIALQILHPADAADRHDQRADGAEEGPGTRVDDMIVVVRFRVCVCHFIPRIRYRRRFCCWSP